MRIELVKNGYVFIFYIKKFILKNIYYKSRPLSISFEVYDDFFQYRSGIYHHTFLSDVKNYKFSPFELTNHAGN